MTKKVKGRQKEWKTKQCFGCIVSCFVHHQPNNEDDVGQQFEVSSAVAAVAIQ